MGRRNLNDDRRAVLAARLRQVTSREAKRVRTQVAAQAKNGKGFKRHTSGRKQTKRNTRDEAARTLRVSRRKVMRAIRLMDLSPALADDVLKGKLSLALAERQAIQQAHQRAWEHAAKTTPRGCRIWTGDFRKVGRKIADGSVSMILSDPPYSAETVPLYGAGKSTLLGSRRQGSTATRWPRVSRIAGRL